MNPRRNFWLIGGILGVFLFVGLCGATFAGAYFIFAVDGPNSSSQINEAPPAVQIAPEPRQAPTAVPQAPIVIQPGSDGFDYETAVLTAIYEKVNLSVVNVDVLSFGRNLPIPDQLLPNPDELNPDDLFPRGQGSGFVWDTEGHIVTNAHVVAGADQVQITFPDGTMSIAEVVGLDQHSDLAVLSIDPEGYTLIPVARGDLDSMVPGMRVAAIGNPFGFEGTLTSGIISAIGRSIPAATNFSIPEAIQTDAAINPGNSGGPLLNEKGEVIGVNAQIRSSQSGNTGVGFAIPITIVERVVPALIAEGSYEHSYIGLSGNTFSPICAESMGLSTDIRGAYVAQILPGTPAARSGLRGGSQQADTNLIGVCPQSIGGDLIIAIDDQPITQFDDILIYLERYTSPGDTIVLTVLRDGREMQVEVRLAARPDSVQQ